MSAIADARADPEKCTVTKSGDNPRDHEDRVVWGEPAQQIAHHEKAHHRQERGLSR
jgi:hypothetical protein